MYILVLLKFTPLEFETYENKKTGELKNGVKIYSVGVWNSNSLPLCKSAKRLKFTPLEFETLCDAYTTWEAGRVKIYSVGVWNM